MSRLIKHFHTSHGPLNGGTGTAPPSRGKGTVESSSDGTRRRCVPCSHACVCVCSKILMCECVLASMNLFKTHTQYTHTHSLSLSLCLSDCTQWVGQARLVGYTLYMPFFQYTCVPVCVCVCVDREERVMTVVMCPPHSCHARDSLSPSHNWCIVYIYIHAQRVIMVAFVFTFLWICVRTIVCVVHRKQRLKQHSFSRKHTYNRMYRYSNTV